MLKSQGFRRNRKLSPVYNMEMKDAASGMVYRLTLPTSRLRFSKGEYLRLESPELKVARPTGNEHKSPLIPESVIAAAQDKMEEIASYLKS
jgi:hypothetical protein